MPDTPEEAAAREKAEQGTSSYLLPCIILSSSYLLAYVLRSDLLPSSPVLPSSFTSNPLSF
eukprot:774503-Rhodomonas_salina.3